MPNPKQPDINLLSPSYKEFLKNNQWDGYLTAFCQDGLSWFFNMDFLNLVIHAGPLFSHQPTTPPPPRLLFLLDSINPETSMEQFDRHYQDFIANNDNEAACAAMSAVVNAIFMEGNRFDRFDPWDDHIDRLFSSSGDTLSLLAQASLYGLKALIGFNRKGGIQKGIEYFKKQRDCAETARSDSLLVYSAAQLILMYLHSGHFINTEILLFDTLPLCEKETVPEANKIFVIIALGLNKIIQGQLSEAKSLLKEVIMRPTYAMLPLTLHLLGIGHYLHASALDGDEKGVKWASELMQKKAVQEQNHFTHGYIHFGLGAVALLLGDPEKALVYGEEGLERALKSGSLFPPPIGWIFIGQALSDLGRYEEARRIFEEWIEKLKDAGLIVVASTGILEIAHILLKQDKTQEAKNYFHKAWALLPDGKRLFMNHRPPEMLDTLLDRLFEGVPPKIVYGNFTTVPIHVQTFGTLAVCVNGTSIPDKQWSGKRAQLLLKTLIALGGTKISMEKLGDLLCPDADGDFAQTNLKTILSRLRRVCKDANKDPLPWILVKHKTISIINSLCMIDALNFQNIMATTLKDKDYPRIQKGLDLYTDDFLVNDTDPWIVSYRESLCELFVQGTISFFEYCLKTRTLEPALPYLQKGVEKDPLNETLYASLMTLFLKTGYPSQALKVYTRAKDILFSELEVKPGPQLRQLAREAEDN